MPSASQVMYALYGAYRLARFDAAGMRYFETSIEGFWRSFFAAVIVAPPYAVLLLLRYRNEFAEVDPLRYLCVETIAYVIAWVLFPLVMVTVAEFLERRERYLGYIVAYNWAAVLQNLFYLPFAMLSRDGGAEIGALDFFSLVAFGAIMVYTWFVTKTALDVPGGTAAAVVVLDLVLGVFLNLFAESML